MRLLESHKEDKRKTISKTVILFSQIAIRSSKQKRKNKLVFVNSLNDFKSKEF
jgi:hypothetical protein